MASGVGNKYHVALSQVSTGSVVQSPVGYLIRGNGYVKQDADTFAPRFNTGEQGLNNLDLWKTYQATDFSGGMFQQRYKDSTMYSSIIGGIPSPTDGMLYQVPSPTTGTMPAGAYDMRAQTAWFIGSLYFIINKSATGAIYLWNDTTKAMTAVKTDFATAVSGMCVVNNILWVATSGGLFWAYDGTTWTSQASYGVTMVCGFNDAIYSNGTSTTNDRGKLWKHTNVIGAAGTAIGAVGDVNKPFNSMVVFNHRLYIGKADGLFAYDGVQVSCILDYSADNANSNFTYMTVAKGVLYLTIKNSLYKFNGSSIELIRDFGSSEYIYGLSVAYDRLWVLTYNTSGTIAHRFYYYNGVGFFCYAEILNTEFAVGGSNNASTVGFADTGSRLLFGFSGKVGVADAVVYHVDTTKEYSTGLGRGVTIDTSEFDAGFPYIDKYCDSVTLTYEGQANGDTLTVYFNIHDGTSWSGWSSTVGGVFKRMKIRVVLTRALATSQLSLKSFSFRYFLSPDMKRKWNVTFLCQGNSDNPLELLDGSTETTTPKQLREQIYACRINDVPSFFEDIDTCKVAIDPGAAGTSITVDDTSAFPPSGYIKIENEYILYGAKTNTIFYNCTRGRWGTTAVAHTAGTLVGSAYRVVISKIQSERVVTPNITDGIMDTYGNESEIVAQLQEV